MKNKFLNKFSNILFYFSILAFIIAFNFRDNPSGGWYQQFMPNLNGRSISDIIFFDSLTGYAVTNNLSGGDTGYILKTTNGGDNWNFSFSVNREFTSIGFINENIGYACGGSGGGTTYLCKTTNAGLNWFSVNSPSAAKWRDMSVLNNDTLWLVDSDGLTGGVFRTTNGGANWQRQLNLFGQNPNSIYIYNRDIGFISNVTQLYKTTNSGENWTPIPGGPFTDIYFADSLTGWKVNAPSSVIRKTNDGGD
ncbi:MAG: hypothetical protein IPM38_00340 [Ignavibacteria bacterium]|nr:hypothetical protein [Ignavibacteria bacterium]